MADDPRQNVGIHDPEASEYINPRLREYILRVYNFMACALIVSGLTAHLAAQAGFYEQITRTPLIWVVMLAPLAAVLFLSPRIKRMSEAAAQLRFWILAILMGLSLSGIFLVYTGASIARTFFIEDATFAEMSLYGYQNGRGPTRFGSWLFMGMIGIILASLINLSSFYLLLYLPFT